MYACINWWNKSSCGIANVRAGVGSETRGARLEVGLGVGGLMISLLQQIRDIVENEAKSDSFYLPNKLTKPLDESF